MSEENKEIVVAVEEVTDVVSEAMSDGIEVTQSIAVPAKKKHGKLGVASFILALASGLVIIMGIVISAKAALSLGDPNAIAMNPESISPDLLGPLMAAGIVMMLGAGLSFVGLILGVIGLFMKNTKKVFAIIGSLLNGLPLLLVIFFMIIGLAMQGAM